MLRSYVCMEFGGIHVNVKDFISKVFKSENKNVNIENIYICFEKHSLNIHMQTV